MEYLTVNELERRTGAIELSPEEAEILSSIKLDWRELGEPEDVRRNGETACKLTKILLQRQAIPEPRRRYFSDPDYKPGHRKGSRLDMLKYGNDLDYALTHPNFLRHLQYFLYGASLPAAAIREFCRRVADCGYVSSSDVEPLRKLARQLTRTHGLNPSDAADEFCKLALDCGMGLHYADSIRQAVMQVR